MQRNPKLQGWTIGLSNWLQLGHIVVNMIIRPVTNSVHLIRRVQAHQEAPGEFPKGCPAYRTYGIRICYINLSAPVKLQDKSIV